MDLIDRERFCEKQCCDNDPTQCLGFRCPILNAPRVNARPITYAEWEAVREGSKKHMECTRCRSWNTSNRVTPFCPHCGAQMLAYRKLRP